MAQGDPITDFMALPQDKQLALLKRLPRDNQDRLLSQVKARRTQSKGPAPTASVSPIPKWSDPGGIPYHLRDIRNRVIENLPNIGGIAGGLVGTGAGAESGPGAIATGAIGAAAGGGLGEGARQAIMERLYPNAPKMAPRQAAAKIAEQAAVQGAYDIVGHGVGKVGKALPATGREFLAAKEAIGPTVERVQGVEVPQLLAERTPNTAGAALQRSLKKSGMGKRQFEKVGEEQQAAVKEAVRRSFAGASRRSIAADEPAEMATAASNALRGRAHPLYSRVWASRVQVPFDQGPMLTLGPVKDVWQGLMRREGIGKTTQLLPNKSIGLMHQFRSALKSAAEASRNVNGRLDRSGEMLNDAAHEIDDRMRKSLAAQNPGALKMWERANDLWAQSYAMDEVGRVLAKTTEGTPIAAQVGGRAAAVPTEIQGASLVKRLNELDRDGSLGRAFPDKGKAIRSLADMLDRAQAIKAADPNLWRVNYMTRYGMELALAGGAGLLAGKGHTLNPSFAGAAVLAFLGARFGEGVLVKMMTDREALPWITRLASAADSQGVRKAANALYVIAPTLLRVPAAVNAPAPRRNPPEQPVAGEHAQNPTDAWSGAAVE